MAENRETYWALVPSFAQIRGKQGEALNVGERDAQDSVVVNGARYPIDAWDRVTVVEPDMGDAVVNLMVGLGAEVISMTEE